MLPQKAALAVRKNAGDDEGYQTGVGRSKSRAGAGQCWSTSGSTAEAVVGLEQE